MNIQNKKKYYLSKMIDFLVVNIIMIVVFISIDNLLNFLFPSNSLYFVGIAKPYISFLEGIMSGTLISIYVLLKKKVNMIAIGFGMWLLPIVKYSIYKPSNDLEGWLIYFSELSMFLGAFCIFFYLIRFTATFCYVQPSK